MSAGLAGSTLTGMHNGEFNLPRLACVYDAFCPCGRSDQFFLEAVNEKPYAHVLDLGCGTGQLSLRLAEAGHTVTGIDPALASLDVARAKAGAEKVTWLHGLAADATASTFDVALMTNHVVQFLTDDEEWHRTLARTYVERSNRVGA